MAFADILNKAPSEVDRPKPLPVGSYQCLVKGLFRQDKSTKKGTNFAEFTLQFMHAFDDVDADSLEAALTKPSGEKVKLQEKSIKATYYITEDAIWRLKDFLEHCGIDLEEHESLLSGMQATPNATVGIFLKHVPSDDGSTVYANIGKTFKIED